MPVGIIDLRVFNVFSVSGIHTEIVRFIVIIIIFFAALVGKQLPTLVILAGHGSIFARAQSSEVLGIDRHSMFAAAGANGHVQSE